MPQSEISLYHDTTRIEHWTARNGVWETFDDVVEAWGYLFVPDESVSIRVNFANNSATITYIESSKEVAAIHFNDCLVGSINLYRFL